jgi:ABC-2 type transport system ATP-binding protein
MQQRLHLARALLHDPELIFLDEPTVGIDPVGARELRSTVKELLARGKTLLMTTHYMAEAEELCDRIAIVKHGSIVALDTPAALKRSISGDSLIDVQVKKESLPVLNELLARLDGRSCVKVLDVPPFKKISIRTPEPGAVMQLLAPYLNPEFILGLEVRNQTLEDVYVAIIQGDQA